jgi:hypothetical protein
VYCMTVDEDETMNTSRSAPARMREGCEIAVWLDGLDSEFEQQVKLEVGGLEPQWDMHNHAGAVMVGQSMRIAREGSWAVGTRPWLVTAR